jgi:DNA replication and repair protein RecF
LILNSNHSGNGRLRKEVLIDGIKRRLFEAVGFFNSVLFLPQMTRILEDGPDERRKYLDQLFSQAFPGYVKALSDYQQALSHRNALLRQLFEKGGDQNQLVYWDEMIADNGATIMRARSKSLAEFQVFLKEQFGNLTGDREKISIAYQPSFDGAEMKDSQMNLGITSNPDTTPDHEEIKQKFLKQLIALRREEIQRGVTTIGPHRDDIKFYSNDLDLGVYGSRGQIRTTVMAMKITEIEWLKDKTGELPVLLLDETLAELDELRRSDLLGSLGLDEQAILTTTDLGLFSKEFIKTCQVWQVEEGKIRKAGQ